MGPTGHLFDVTLRFRGVVEARSYGPPLADAGIAPAAGGTSSQLFQVGGGSGVGSANIYELTIDDPPQTFYLNSATPQYSGVRGLDYTVTIPMMAAANLQLIADPVDGIEYENAQPDGGPVVPAGVPPAPAAFNGQFVQVDVIAVTPRAK
jgi:hypothetical protein